MLSTFALTVLTSLVATPILSAAPQGTHADDVKAYKEILKDRERESEAIALIDGFTNRYAEHSERMIEIADAIEIDEGDIPALKKESKKLVEAQEDLADLVWLSFKERKRDTEGHRRLWTSAVFAFGQMGPTGAKYLWKAYEDKRFRKDVEFRGRCVQQVGSTLDWDQWEDLVDLLDHHEDLIIAKAAEALKHYREAPGKIRVEVTSKLVNFLNSYYNAANNPEDTTARQRYRMVGRPMREALSEMTGQSFQDPLKWRLWFNDNKKNKEIWSDD